MSRRRCVDERGTVAVIFAICALVLFGVAAMGVDLGNAMNRKKENQTSSDFAALAGASGLPITDSTTVQKVADYLNKNQPASDGTDKCNTSTGPITVSDLTDGDNSNGEVTFPDSDHITVVAPATKVAFGLANAIGFSDTCVQTAAEARIASGSVGMAPYYATSSCSTGPQVLKSDAGGPSIPFTVPVLSHDGESNTSVLSSTDPNPNPNQISLATVGDPDGPLITIAGTHLNAATIDQVGFFNSDRSEPKQAVPLSSPAQTATSVSVDVPNSVASYQDVWWIRVHNATNGKWSARSEARPLLVGDAVLSCDPYSADGNFGSIDLPHGSHNDQTDLTANIRDGLLPPLTLATYPGPPWPPGTPPPSDCAHQAAAVVSTDASLMPNTNCVESVTGLKATAAYDGYLENPDGRLRVDTSPACQATPQSRPARVTLSTGEQVNDDRLSCFLKNDSLHLSDTIYYHGTDGLFTQDIWDSPRFVLVPIIPVDPGGDKWMPISGFVPGFITDEVTGSSRSAPVDSGQTENGLSVQHPHKLRAIRIFFFSLDALPPPPDGSDLQDYLGAGKKVISLVN